MTTYLWAIDTPWAKKGTEYTSFELTLFNHIKEYEGKRYDLSRDKLIDLGWIKPVEKTDFSQSLKKLSEAAGFCKPVEDKKLTEDEILEAITMVAGHREVSAFKLAKLLAEHLK